VKVERGRWLVAALGCAIALFVSGCAQTTVPSDGLVQPQTAAVGPGTHVFVAVSVATLWVSPRSPRAVDAPALASPVRIRQWLQSMSTTTRRGLTGRIETQALYGDPLTVIAVSGSWLQVVAPGQSTSRDRRGYPGWVPRRQVTGHEPTRTTSTATVTALTAWLRDAAGNRTVEVSFGTRLPVLSTGSANVRVATPTGMTLRVALSKVAVRAGIAAVYQATRASIVALAKRFLGLPYLWGGRSGFALDCSGLTGLVFGVHGVRLPRDADDQSHVGAAVSPAAARSGDLAFYGPSAAPTHVALYVSGSTLIQAPSAAHPVDLVRASNMPRPVRVRRAV
jgi:cell wall-associated NlpC family hydrolase